MTTEAVRFRVGWRATRMTRARDGDGERFTILSRQKPLATAFALLPVGFLAVATVIYARSHLDIVTAAMVGLLGYMLYELARANFGAILLRLGSDVEVAAMLLLPGIGAVPLGPRRSWPLSALSNISLLQTEYGKAKTKPVDWPGFGLEIKSERAAPQRLISGVTLEQAQTLREAILARVEREQAQ